MLVRKLEASVPPVRRRRSRILVRSMANPCRSNCQHPSTADGLVTMWVRPLTSYGERIRISIASQLGSREILSFASIKPGLPFVFHPGRALATS
jgi:hypothetical protein